MYLNRSRQGATVIDLNLLNMEDTGSQTPLQESVSNEVFIAPSVQELVILSGHSYTHHSSIPHALAQDLSTECVLGVDEAGRGPVLGTELNTDCP